MSSAISCAVGARPRMALAMTRPYSTSRQALGSSRARMRPWRTSIFDDRWLTPAEIGYRAATAALSDLAAMAASPLAMLVAMTIPESWRTDVGEIADGIGEAARAFDAPITGGNLTGGGELAITVTVLGSAEHPLRRDAARAGDTLYVTGTLGGPRSALDAWISGREPRADHRARFAHPTARIREARWLTTHGAHAAIDVSDGLVADARHLAIASGVMACIRARRDTGDEWRSPQRTRR